MMSAAAKTLNDLPHFRVSAIRQAEDNAEYFELMGVLDRTTDVPEGRCSLLLPQSDVLTALNEYLEFRNVGEKAVSVHTPSRSRPDVEGIDLTYIHPNWDPVHVWMVALPTWKWNRVMFQATDAITKIVKGNDVSMVDGEEVTEWIQVKEKGKETGLSRYYPVFPSGKITLKVDEDGTMTDGWNHAHCELCQAHIDAGNYGYVDPGERWVCEACYARYVSTHDLSFMFV